jgi:hypothetical protein
MYEQERSSPGATHLVIQTTTTGDIMSKTFQRSRITRSLLTAAATMAAVLAVTAAPASAAPPWPVD